MVPVNNLKPYVVKINGLDHTLRLNEADAKRYGERAKPVTGKKQSKPKNKAKTPADKQSKTEGKKEAPAGQAGE